MYGTSTQRPCIIPPHPYARYFEIFITKNAAVQLFMSKKKKPTRQQPKLQLVSSQECRYTPSSCPRYSNKSVTGFVQRWREHALQNQPPPRDRPHRGMPTTLSSATASFSGPPLRRRTRCNVFPSSSSKSLSCLSAPLSCLPPKIMRCCSAGMPCLVRHSQRAFKPLGIGLGLWGRRGSRRDELPDTAHQMLRLEFCFNIPNTSDAGASVGCWTDHVLHRKQNYSLCLRSFVRPCVHLCHIPCMPCAMMQ